MSGWRVPVALRGRALSDVRPCIWSRLDVTAIISAGRLGHTSKQDRMRLLRQISLILLCTALAVFDAQAQTVLKIPPIKASIKLDQQPVEITLWGTLSPSTPGNFTLALTMDLGDLQTHLTGVLSAQLNRSDRCGDRLSLDRAALAPSAPSSVLTANVNFERFGCVKAFGKQIAKRLLGGHAVIEVNLTPVLEENDIALTAEVRKIDADGSPGDALRSDSVADSIREKIGSAVESTIQKLTNLKSTLPAGIGNSVTIQTVQFADGGAGRLWLTLAAEVALSAEQLRSVVGQ